MYRVRVATQPCSSSPGPDSLAPLCPKCRQLARKHPTWIGRGSKAHDGNELFAPAWEPWLEAKVLRAAFDSAKCQGKRVGRRPPL